MSRSKLVMNVPLVTGGRALVGMGSPVIVHTRWGQINVCATLEFKLADLWVGLFYKFTRMQRHRYTDIWLCLLPCLPLHINIFFAKKRSIDVNY